MNYVYIAQSLDGYIAGPNGELEWLEQIDNPEKSDFGFAEFMGAVDALVMGRHTFEKVVSFGFWPYDKPVFVMSRTLTTIPPDLSDKAFLLSSEPRETVETLNAKGYNNLYIDGGLLIQSFLRAGLINELIVSTLPVLLGDDIKHFGHLPSMLKLKLLNSETLVNQMVKTRYQVENR